MGRVGIVAAIALLVIAALGLSGHVSARTVGATLVGVGAGGYLLGYVIQKHKKYEDNIFHDTDGLMAFGTTAIALGVGIGAMMGGISLRAVSAIGLTGAVLKLVVGPSWVEVTRQRNVVELIRDLPVVKSS